MPPTSWVSAGCPPWGFHTVGGTHRCSFLSPACTALCWNRHPLVWVVIIDGLWNQCSGVMNSISGFCIIYFGIIFLCCIWIVIQLCLLFNFVICFLCICNKREFFCFCFCFWIFFSLLILFIHLFWLCWVFVAACGLSLVAASGETTLHCSARASHCGGFSCCGARALGARASVVVAHGLSSCGSRALECRFSSCGAWA